MLIRRFLSVLSPFLLVGAAVAAQSPTGVSPGSATRVSRIADPCPTFSWSSVPAARAYELIVYKVGEEAEEVVNRTIRGSALSWTPDLDSCLSPGTEYAWSVRAVGRKYSSDWSYARLFRVTARQAEMELEEALAVLRRYLASARETDDELDQVLDDSVDAESETAAVAAELTAALGGQGGGQAIDPATETTVLFRDEVGDNFGLLVDSFGVSGSELGLHVGQARYASLAKNAYFLGGWQRFNESYGAFLQEIYPAGEVVFSVAQAGTNPILWTKVLHFDTEGRVGVGATPFIESRFHSYGASSLHGVSGSTNASTHAGVYGSTATAGGYGVWGLNSSSSGDAVGLYGRSSSSTGSGVAGLATAEGVNNGVHGRSNSMTGRGVYGEGGAFSGANIGVLGESNSAAGFGIYGKSKSGNHAGFFEGKVGVDGPLHIGPSGDLVTLSFNDTTDVLTVDQEVSITGDLTANQLVLQNQETVSNGVDGTVTVGATYLQIPSIAAAPSPTDCDAAGIGRMVYETGGGRLYVCGNAGWTSH